MFDPQLEDKVAVVTGGSRGIGKACVEALASAGARCVIGYRERSAEADELVEEIGRLGGEAVAFGGDLTDPVQCRELIDTAVSHFGAVHIVVNNAGVWRRASIDTMTDRELDETVEINLKAVFRITRHAARAMGKQPFGGSIVHIASTAGQRGEAHYSHYAATKGAVIAMVKSLAAELAPRIRVNAVSPGWVETEMIEGALEGNGRRTIESTIPLARIGQPEDIAPAVLFLASPLASWITGEVLCVNGGGVL